MAQGKQAAKESDRKLLRSKLERSEPRRKKVHMAKKEERDTENGIKKIQAMGFNHGFKVVRTDVFHRKKTDSTELSFRLLCTPILARSGPSKPEQKKRISGLESVNLAWPKFLLMFIRRTFEPQRNERPGRPCHVSHVKDAELKTVSRARGSSSVTTDMPSKKHGAKKAAMWA